MNGINNGDKNSKPIDEKTVQQYNGALIKIVSSIIRQELKKFQMNVVNRKVSALQSQIDELKNLLNQNES